MKKAIITGPTGAVGVSLIEELVSKNIRVTAICRQNSKRIGAIPKNELVDVVECDISNYSSLADTLTKDYDAFYHFAWDGTYGDTRQDMVLQSKNIEYTIDAVHLAYDLGCKVFVGAGSQSEFGHVDGVLHPHMACNPDNGYGIAKLAACRMSRIECNKLGIRHEWCRIVSLYGPFDGMHTMVMSTIKSLLDGEEPKCTKAEQTWDYIYSKDAAKAFRLVAEQGKDGEIYCLGSGKPKKLKEYIELIRDAVNPELTIHFGAIPYYQNQVMHLEADIENLKADTGYTSDYSFEEGIKETIEWVKKN